MASNDNEKTCPRCGRESIPGWLCSLCQRDVIVSEDATFTRHLVWIGVGAALLAMVGIVAKMLA